MSMLAADVADDDAGEVAVDPSEGLLGAVDADAGMPAPAGQLS